MNSGKGTESAITAVGATASLAVTPWLSGALYVRLGRVVDNDIASQTTARKEA